MDRLPNIHPGEILQEEFLTPLGITPYRLSHAIGVQQTRISEIINGKRSITPDTAIRLARFFKTTPEFWLNLQRQYDLEEAQLERGKDYEEIRAYDYGQAVTA
ncbi:MAG TPA: HigA family addiction module antitoxin [Chthonomonadaceae bacterium]|nr:HigA family addiction module antitoxin [Chthonomonadaceae bacterium]